MINTNNDKPLIGLSSEELPEVNIYLILEKKKELARKEQELESMSKPWFGMNFLTWEEGEALVRTKAKRAKKQEEVADAKHELEKLEAQVCELLPIKEKDVSVAANNKPYHICYVTDKHGYKRQLVLKHRSH